MAIQLASLLRRAGLPSLAADADGEARRLTAGVPTFAVVGEFKRGKSSLINALIGADLLPVGALPLTAVATRVEFGETARVVVEFLDGRTTEIDGAAIGDYATERGNAGNQRGVAAVTIAVPSPLLRAPLDLIDTPGIGSAFADVSDVARAVLTQADTALVVLSAEQPASRRELDFVREVLGAGLPTFVVENKVDLIAPGERESVVEFVRDQVRGVRGGELVPVFPLSSTAPATSGGRALEAALVEFVRRDGRPALARGARRRLLRIVARARAAIELRERADPLAQSWQEERRSELRQHANNALFRDLLDARERVATVASEIVSRLDALAAKTTAEERLEMLVGGDSMDDSGRGGRQWAVALETNLRRRIGTFLNEWSDAERRILSAAAAEISSRWPARVAGVLQPILGSLRLPSVPALDFVPPIVALPPMRATRSLVLPGALGRQRVQRRALGWWRASLPRLLDARRDAVARSVADALQHAERSFHQHVGSAVEQAIATRVGERSDTGAAADERIAAELQELYGRLRDDTGS